MNAYRSASAFEILERAIDRASEMCGTARDGVRVGIDGAGVWFVNASVERRSMTGHCVRKTVHGHGGTLDGALADLERIVLRIRDDDRWRAHLARGSRDF